MGEEFGIVRFDFENSFLQLGIMGGVAARFDISRITNDLQIADYTLVLPVDYVRDRFILRLMYWHTSSHIGDDYIASNAIASTELEKNVTDDMRLILNFDILSCLRVYEGYMYSFNTIPDTDKPHGVIWGSEFKLPFGKQDNKEFFIYVDFRALQRLGWQPSFNSRTGVKFLGDKSAFSVSAEFFAGHLLYLGFAERKETHLSLVMAFEM